jgi:hypothetical protein
MSSHFESRFKGLVGAAYTLKQTCKNRVNPSFATVFIPKKTKLNFVISICDSRELLMPSFRQIGVFFLIYCSFDNHP